jgi:hypothetical protein
MGGVVQMTTTILENYTFERTSACHGEGNPGGFGWLIEFAIDGKDNYGGPSHGSFTMPDNIAIEFAKMVLEHQAKMEKA